MAQNALVVFSSWGQLLSSVAQHRAIDVIRATLIYTSWWSGTVMAIQISRPSYKVEKLSWANSRA